MKKTFKEILEYNSVITNLYKRNPEVEKTKFGYAIKKFGENVIAPIFKKYNEEVQEIRVDNALVDEKTQEILLDNESVRGFKYSKEGFKKLLKEEKSIDEKWEKKEFEVEAYKAKDVPELSEIELESIKGFLI